jgi:DNA repair exonuclease SbcCD nuclease subunit
MTKILSSADWHINLHKKKIPYEWQYARFKSLFSRLQALEKQCDVHVIAGDLFDRKPEPDEVCLALSYLNAAAIPTLLIPGNHEATRKGETFLSHFTQDYAINNPLVYIATSNKRIELAGLSFMCFPYGSVQTNQLPEFNENDILVTHIRGEVPPHISAEFDFELLRPWKLVLLGDLHFRHKYQDYNIYYPGSPLNTTFDRDASREYGVDIVDINSLDEYSVNFVDLQLPKLIRKTVKAGEPLVASDYNHVIYEVVGSIDQISKVERSDLLDKKLIEKPSSNATLDLKNKTLVQELELYLQQLKISDVDAIINEFKMLGISYE